MKWALILLLWSAETEPREAKEFIIFDNISEGKCIALLKIHFYNNPEGASTPACRPMPLFK